MISSGALFLIILLSNRHLDAFDNFGLPEFGRELFQIVQTICERAKLLARNKSFQLILGLELLRYDFDTRDSSGINRSIIFVDLEN